MTDEELEDRHTVIKGNDYYKVPPIKKGSCNGCSRHEANLSCANIECDGKFDEEFILIDYSMSGLARYISQKLT